MFIFIGNSVLCLLFWNSRVLFYCVCMFFFFFVTHVLNGVVFCCVVLCFVLPVSCVFTVLLYCTCSLFHVALTLLKHLCILQYFQVVASLINVAVSFMVFVSGMLIHHCFLHPSRPRPCFYSSCRLLFFLISSDKLPRSSCPNN